MRTTSLHDFCCGMCGSQEFTSFIDQTVRRLVRKISGHHTWHFILRKDYYRGADKSLARTTFRCFRTESIVSLEANLLLR